MEANRIKKKILWVLISICLIIFFIWGLAFRLVLPSIWNFLVIQEELKQADVIVVLGGDRDRVDYGVKLFHLGFANKILLTGSDDALRMSRRAVSLGVPESNILLETQSRTTFENAQYSTEIMRNQGFESAIIVTSPYHTRRASIIFDYFSKGIDITIYSIPYDSSIVDNWWKDKNSIKVIINEYMKLVWHYLVERPFYIFKS